MTKLPGKHAPIDRRLELAIKHVQEMWFPPNKALLGQVRRSLNDGKFDLNEELLVRTLRHDPALFTYCLREVIGLLRQEGVEVPAYHDPVELLEWAGIERLRQILTVDPAVISKHTTDGARDFQISRTEESLVSITTTQLLAEKGGFDPDLGYSAGLLRQLGYTLIAWNYPHIYKRVVATLRPEGDLDTELAQALGFSPLTLSLALAENWKAPRELCDVLMPNAPHVVQIDEIGAIADTLKKLCEIGETLARANAPEVYPTARSDWAKAQDLITARLGKNGMKLIQERVQASCTQYLTTAPHLFQAGLVLDPDAKLRRAGQTPENPYIRDCASGLQGLLGELYQTITANEAIEQRLRFLVRTILPEASFSHGCVFTVDPGTIMLIPQLPFGRCHCHAFEPVPCKKNGAQEDIIAKAFFQTQPVVEEKHSADAGAFTCLAGVLGYGQRMGVLYTEISSAKFAMNPKQHILHFKALSHALNDSLELR